MRILFLCVDNAGRSQMAEAFARQLAPSGIEVFSAGSRPAQQIHPAVLAAMREVGIELGDQIPKGLESLPAEQFDAVVEMGCGDACPTQGGKRMISWDIPNPKDQSLEVVRQIRNQIEEKVRDLLSKLPFHQS